MLSHTLQEPKNTKQANRVRGREALIIYYLTNLTRFNFFKKSPKQSLKLPHFNFLILFGLGNNITVLVQSKMRHKATDAVLLSIEQVIHKGEQKTQSLLSKMPADLQDLFLNRLTGSASIKIQKSRNITQLHHNIRKEGSRSKGREASLNPEGFFRQSSNNSKTMKNLKPHEQLKPESRRQSIKVVDSNKSLQAKARPHSSQPGVRNKPDMPDINRDQENKTLTGSTKHFNWNYLNTEKNRSCISLSRKSASHSRPNPHQGYGLRRNTSISVSSLSRHKEIYNDVCNSQIPTDAGTEQRKKIGAVAFKQFSMIEIQDVMRKGTLQHGKKLIESNFVRKMKRKEFFNCRRTDESLLENLSSKQMEFLQLLKKNCLPRSCNSHSKTNKQIAQPITRKKARKEGEPVCGWEVSEVESFLLHDEY